VDDKQDSFYVVNLTKATFAEIWQAANRAIVPMVIIGALKLFRRPWRCGSPVSFGAADRIDSTEIPQDVLHQMQEPLLQLRDLGFTVIGATHKLFVGVNEGYTLELLSDDRLTGCSLLWVRNKTAGIVSETVAISMSSQRRGGTALGTSNVAFGLKTPRDILAVRLPGASPAEVYEKHCQRIRSLADVVSFDADSRMKFVEELGDRSNKFNVERGLYVPATEEELRNAMS
jgi:hypothetical protein